jgi:hypothetical protein
MDGEVSSGKKKPISGNSGTLAQEIMSSYEPTMKKLGLLPTPTKSDYNQRWKTENWEGNSDLPSVINEICGTRSHLSTQFVGEMMGFPENWTELPFQNGEKKV